MRYRDVAARLTPSEMRLVNAAIAADARAVRWRPLIDTNEPDRPTPQRLAFESLADILLYGGAAGGGKTDLIAGMAAIAHRRSLILRHEAKQLAAITDRLEQIIGNRIGFNEQRGRWKTPDGRVIDLGGLKDPGSEKRYQGQPHDLIGIDEVTEIPEHQFRFVVLWNRSASGERCRIVCASNPPTTAEGEWIVRFWAPWLDDQHPNPALPGELRWFIMTPEGDREVAGPEPVMVNGEMLIPRSRTFIPSSVDDNPFLGAEYKAALQAAPEPLRSQMLRGDFLAGREDHEWQVIPSAWARAAQDRWQATVKPSRPMDALGVDPARGGRDEMVLAPRYGDYYAELIVRPGVEVEDGALGAAFVVTHLRDGAAAHVDIIGYGSSCYDHLKGNGVNVVAIQSAEGSDARDKSGKFGFANKRSELWWRFREALDPTGDDQICLPPDNRLLADLCAPRWKLLARGIQVETKDEIKKRLGRSPDRGDAVVYALPDTPRKHKLANLPKRANSSYSPHRWRQS